MKKLFLLFILQSVLINLVAQVSVTNLFCESLHEPIGLGVKQPRFSWQLTGDKRNLAQTAYEIKIADGSATAWTSGKVLSDQSVYVQYAGKPLESEKKYHWQVRAWDNYGNVSSWSQPASFQLAMFNEVDPAVTSWKADWIGPGMEDSINRPSQLLRKEFKTAKKIRSATAYITAHGMYEGYINGKRIGDFYLTPGWTSYNKRLQYQTYDVTGLLNSGSNVIAMALGSGWYRGFLAWDGNKDVYGKDAALLFQLDITYTDGSKESVVSNDSWKSTTGSITYSEIYN